MKKVKRTLIVVLAVLVIVMGLFVFKNPVNGIPSNIKNDEKTFDLTAELKKYDLTTPEKTMDLYIKFLKIGDRKGLAVTFGSNQIVPEHWKPEPIKNYEIKKKTAYSEKYINDLIKNGQMPSPPHQVGDVELQVKEIYSAGKSASGTYTYKDGEDEMFTYWFRKSGNYWFLTTLCSWNED